MMRLRGETGGVATSSRKEREELEREAVSSSPAAGVRGKRMLKL